eukprot:scaffold188430_cov18-Tisochrysis_lutea.AAC.1
MECKAGSCLELAQHPLNRNGSGGQEVPVCRLRLRVWTVRIWLRVWTVRVWCEAWAEGVDCEVGGFVRLSMPAFQSAPIEPDSAPIELL